MRTLLLVALVLFGCKKSSDGPRKLKKMDFKVAVDEKGRILPQIELFDDKHSPIVVEGSYTMTIARPDGTVLCSLTRTLAKTDYTDKKLFKADWQDATCPPDPASPDLRVTLEVKAGDKPDAPKIAREKTTPTKFIYRHLTVQPPPPPVGSGSAPEPTKVEAEPPKPEAEPKSDAGSGSAGSAK